MRQELNYELDTYAKKILTGDILNLPLMHKSDFEKVMFYCISSLQNKAQQQVSYIEELEDRICLLEEKNKEDAEKPAPTKKKNWR